MCTGIHFKEKVRSQVKNILPDSQVIIREAKAMGDELHVIVARARNIESRSSGRQPKLPSARAAAASRSGLFSMATTRSTQSG